VYITQGLHQGVQRSDRIATICAGHTRTHATTPGSRELVDALPLSAAGTVLEREPRRLRWQHEERAVH
jgi:hypothetical protein